MIAETISNPLVRVCDIDGCAAIAREAGARLIIDNTFATPYLCRPFEHGADFVTHSATKYLAGHGDVMGGLAIARSGSDTVALSGILKLVGGVLSVWAAHEVMRGLKTLALRMERQCANAARLATVLAQDRRIARVHYPGLNRQELVNRMLRPPHAGTIVSIELAESTREAAFRVMDALKLCVRSTSLGDIFTSILHPAMASHREVPLKRRRHLGITEGLIRISVGIEDIGDVMDDIDQALGVLERSKKPIRSRRPRKRRAV